jgi:Lysyl oxidase
MSATREAVKRRKEGRNLVRKFMLSACLAVLALVVLSSASARDPERDFPVYDNGGKPDLTVDSKRFVNQMSIIDRWFEPGSCDLEEGSVGAPGYRRILRFDTVLINGGDGDLVVGNRADPGNPYADYFYFAQCHGHYHLRDFSAYELLRPDGERVVVGYKQGFCMEDSLKYDGGRSNAYDCEDQGITSGWGDWYYKQLGGQWIDITGVPEGDYIVRVTIDLGGIFDEGADRYPNVVETSIHVPDPRNKVSG